MKLRNWISFLFCCTFVFSYSLFSQDEKKEPEYGWKNLTVGNLNFTQTKLSNWSSGGEDSWTWQLDINGKYLNDQQKYNWANTSKISYGRNKVGDEESKKSADEVSLQSVLTFKIGIQINPYIAVTGLTQLASGFEFPNPTDANPNPAKIEIAKFLNPGYFTESFGLGYEPVKELNTRLGLALKQTLVTEEKFATRYSDDSDTANKLEKIRSEIGLESVSNYQRKLSENILYTTQLTLFSDLRGQDVSFTDNGQVNIVNLSVTDRIDVKWDNVLSAKVSKYLFVSFNLLLFYDSDNKDSSGRPNSKRQLKQVLAAGLTYSFL